MTKKLMIALLVASAAITTSACNTVKGAGQDIESVATSVDDAT